MGGTYSVDGPHGKFITGSGGGALTAEWSFTGNLPLGSCMYLYEVGSTGLYEVEPISNKAVTFLRGEQSGSVTFPSNYVKAGGTYVFKWQNNGFFSTKILAESPKFEVQDFEDAVRERTPQIQKKNASLEQTVSELKAQVSSLQKANTSLQKTNKNYQKRLLAEGEDEDTKPTKRKVQKKSK
jgi:exonuclease VII small subunit